MKTEKSLKEMAALFLSLADGTRLRLLNLMRNGEVCVSSFTDILGQSQPKISRHLAYLRGSGLVEARRDGKWMHYSVASGLDEKSRLLLDELFKWMQDQEALSRDTEKYVKAGLPVRTELFAPESTELDEPEPLPTLKQRRAKQVRTERVPDAPPQPIYAEPEPVYVEPRHNELEDFLL